MENYKDLEEANKEIERSKVILHDSDDSNIKKDKTTSKEEDQHKTVEGKEEGSGIFTADGEELPKIEGGYDIIEPGGTLGDDEFVSS